MNTELLNLADVRAMIIDMDGVLWHGNQALPGLVDFFATIEAMGMQYVLATNNASLTVDQYVTKLSGMGVKINPQAIITSSTATANYLSENYTPDTTKIYVIGEEGAQKPLLEKGFRLTDLYDGTQENQADIVVCGLDRKLTWDKLTSAVMNLTRGAYFVGTNADTTLPTEQGLAIGNGSILAALEAATGVKAFCIGKPEPILYEQAMSLLGSDKNETIAIGDRLNTDILGAIHTEIRSIMVLTGISSKEDIQNSDYQPTWVLPDLLAVTEAFRNARN